MTEKERQVQGLSPEEHGALNKTDEKNPDGVKKYMQMIARLRRKYLGNSVAQQYLDLYAFNTKYTKKLQLYIEALKNHDTQLINKLEKWFKKYYPDL